MAKLQNGEHGKIVCLTKTKETSCVIFGQTIEKS